MDKAATTKRSTTRGRLDDLLGYQLRRASAAMTADFASELGAVRLRPVQFAILSLVADNNGISQSELCRELSVRKANMAPLIAEMESRNLLARRPAPWDRRVQMLALTKEGERQLPAWRKLIAKHEMRFFGPLTSGERGQLTRLLRKLWSNGAGTSGATAAPAGVPGEPVEDCG